MRKITHTDIKTHTESHHQTRMERRFIIGTGLFLVHVIGAFTFLMIF
jgi:hypothetical protein